MDEQTFKKLQRIYDQADNGGKELIEKEFPELKESGDERIRKFLIRICNRCPDNSTDFLGEIKKTDVLSWLEKQKERGPLTTDEMYTLQRIIERLEDEECPQEWKDLLNGIYNLPFQNQGEQKTFEWSNTDEEMFNETIYFLNEFQRSDRCKSENEMQNSVSCEKWLNELINRLTNRQEN